MSCQDQSLSCCPEKQFVQDKVCAEFTSAGVIYTNTLGTTSTSSGYIQNTSASEITATLEDANTTPVAVIIIPAGSTASFTVRNFSTISIELTAPDPDSAPAGEFCVTTRYRI
ncbi:S-Ena type endospore appendage [Bacillus sp. FJAT-45037]|uniref:S-Ena type endospore appendage n=1 Tax=Bacillus sp. FJAT-45037 TaxID=2011007 RepID=UPI000C23F636|nr:S-Ena type endospore appendage [Bacillus sp. FJAT-45037]